MIRQFFISFDNIKWQTNESNKFDKQIKKKKKSAAFKWLLFAGFDCTRLVPIGILEVKSLFEISEDPQKPK